MKIYISFNSYTFYNINVNLIQLFAFVDLQHNSCVLMPGMESVKLS